MLHRRLVLAILTALMGVAPVGAVAVETVTVFGAVSLTDALEEIARRYRAQSETRVRFSFAASSTLARQIEAGAPAEIFASANAQWMARLAERGLIEPGTETRPVGNRLALIAPAASPQGQVEIAEGLDFAALLGPEGRLAVGDPQHVPAGLYARQALENLGLWAVTEPRLARADNVRAALALVARGETPLGIVYASDARVSDKVKVVGVFPPESHLPIAYPFAIVKGAETVAVRAFFRYLVGPAGRAVFRSHGFSVK